MTGFCLFYLLDFLFVVYIFKCLIYYSLLTHPFLPLYLLIFTSIFSTFEMLLLDLTLLFHSDSVQFCACVLQHHADRFPELLEMSSGKPKPVGTLGTH